MKCSMLQTKQKMTKVMQLTLRSERKPESVLLAQQGKHNSLTLRLFRLHVF